MLDQIVVNRIQCNHCKDILTSKHANDFKVCSCGKCAVDGGRLYLKRLCNTREDYTELSEYKRL